MISGFNTDIEFDGVVYHVQTEDKGLNARVIMTLVYNGGTILASKRVPYDDLETNNFDESLVADRLCRQHKLICAAVRAGRMEDLKQMSRKVARAKTGAPAEEPGTATENISAFVPAYLPSAVAEMPIAAPTAVPITIRQVETQRIIPVTSPRDFDRNSDIEVTAQPDEIDIPPVEIPAILTPTAPVPAESSVLNLDDEFIFEDLKIIEEEIVLDSGAVEVVSELSGIERPINEKLSLELLAETKFKGGDRTTVNIMVCRGTARKVVVSAQIMIKVLGSTFRPVIFHAKTDSNGLANVHLQLPHFRAGRAALLVRVIADGEEIELRRVVTPG